MDENFANPAKMTGENDEGGQYTRTINIKMEAKGHCAVASAAR